MISQSSNEAETRGYHGLLVPGVCSPGQLCVGTWSNWYRLNCFSADGISMRGKERWVSAKAVSSKPSLKSLLPWEGTGWVSHWGCVAMLRECFSKTWLFKRMLVLKVSLKSLAVRP